MSQESRRMARVLLGLITLGEELLRKTKKALGEQKIKGIELQKGGENYADL